LYCDINFCFKQWPTDADDDDDDVILQMDIERFLSENLNEHRKGLLGKTVPVGSMLIWTRVCLFARF